MKVALIATVCGLLTMIPLGCHGDGIVHLGAGNNLSDLDAQDATNTDTIPEGSAEDVGQEVIADSRETGLSGDAHDANIDPDASDGGLDASDSADMADSLESGDASEDIGETGSEDGSILSDAWDGAESPDAKGVCDPMDAHSHGACFSIIGLVWNGVACVQVVCMCEGTDCNKMYSFLEAELCVADHKDCIGADQ